MSNVRIRQETIASVWEEVQPLLHLHWKETDKWEDNHIPLAPDQKQYALLDSLNLIHVYTARVDGMLIGYAAYVTTPSLHHNTTNIAMCDVIFVQPVYRTSGIGQRLVGYAEEKLERQGIEYIYMNVKTCLNFGSMLESIGYYHVEEVYSKALGT